MVKSTPKILFLVALLGTVAVAWKLVTESTESNSQREIGTVDGVRPSESHSSEPAAENDLPGSPSGVNVGSTSLNPPHNDGRSTGVKRSALNEPFDFIVQSESVEESLWLRNHGYPTSDEWSQRHSIAEAELERLSGAGNMVAMAMLGERYTNRPGMESKGFDLLNRARDRGSVFAVIVSALEKSRLYGLKEPVADAALQDRNIARRQSVVLVDLTLAMMLGDRRALDLIPSRAMHPGIGERLEIVFMDVSNQMKEIQVHRRQLGLQPLLIAPRP
jgi:hypothetical protein